MRSLKKTKPTSSLKKAYLGATLLLDFGDIDGAAARLRTVATGLIEKLKVEPVPDFPSAEQTRQRILQGLEDFLTASTDVTTKTETVLREALHHFHNGFALIAQRNDSHLGHFFWSLWFPIQNTIRPFFMKPATAWKWIAVFLGVIVLATGSVYISNRKYGFIGEYYLNNNLTNLYFKKRDKSVNFNWSVFGISGKYRNWFSIRWSGYLRAPTPGRYTFKTINDDGARLYIGDTVVIDDWNGHNAQQNLGTVDLTEGYHPIRLEYFENQGYATIQLFWKKPDAHSFSLIEGEDVVTHEKYTR